MFTVLWVILLLPPLLWEAYAIANKTEGDTLSERMRIWFRVHTTGGRVTFAVLWVGFACWFLIHLIG